MRPSRVTKTNRLLEADVHTVFLKADCPPRVKQGILESELAEVAEHDGKWDTIRMESLQEELVDLAEQNSIEALFSRNKSQRMSSYSIRRFARCLCMATIC